MYSCTCKRGEEKDKRYETEKGGERHEQIDGQKEMLNVDLKIQTCRITYKHVCELI